MEGGNGMANRSDSKLRFTIEESVWLRNGQEVAEVLSLSLNPEIAIEEVSEQILIKGYLYLTGEYKPVTKDENQDNLENQSLKDQLQFRSMEQINEVADGVYELEHRFPVDITIPKQRIANVDEVYVNVESFDYDLPSHNCIELTADIEITGLNQESQEEPTYVEDNAVPVRVEDTEEQIPELVASDNEYRTFDEFEFEARKAPEEEKEAAEEEVSENDYSVQRNQPPVVEMKGRESQDSNQNDESEKYRFDYEDSFLSPLKSLSSYTKDDEEEDYGSAEPKNYQQQEYEEYEEAEYNDANELSEPVEKPVREENALYLTSILSREEEEFSRLKMCIVQPGDSLEKVAGRYEVSTSSLVRVNRLDNEEVSEGQILYIPVPAGRV